MIIILYRIYWSHSTYLGIFAPVNSYFSVASHISLCASVLMIVALSHERYFAICSPHVYRIHMRSVSRWKHLAKYIGPVILVSVICNIPMLINIINKDILKNPFYVKVCMIWCIKHTYLPISTSDTYQEKTVFALMK